MSFAHPGDYLAGIMTNPMTGVTSIVRCCPSDDDLISIIPRNNERFYDKTGRLRPQFWGLPITNKAINLGAKE